MRKVLQGLELDAIALDGCQGFFGKFKCGACFEVQSGETGFGNDLGDFLRALLWRNHSVFVSRKISPLPAPILPCRARADRAHWDSALSGDLAN